ncbi:MAG: hypothetical protein JXA46_01565 [Dehalococcoidales bacterium]|nr:hypothetical protein [Dehalococcoidales bacterium]
MKLHRCCLKAVFSSVILAGFFSCSFSYTLCNAQNRIMDPSMSATPVSAGMIRLDMEGIPENSRYVGIFRSEPGNSPEYLTALQPGFSIYLDRDLSSEVVYTYSLFAYDESGSMLLAEASASPLEYTVNAHYIRSDASGMNDGSSWQDAWTSVPESLERGHTYYFADGVYSKVMCDDAEEGTAFIYLKKATPEYHGSDAGWSDAYGDGQAVFAAEDGNILTFRYGYYDVDGQTGSGIGGHGFKTEALSDALTYSILADSTYKTDINLNSCINVYHTEMQLAGCERIPDVTGSGRGFQVRGVLSHSILSHVYIHDLPGIPIYYVNNSYDNIIEYSHVSRNHSDPVSHAEAIQTHTGAEYNIVRYSFWEDIEGTAVLRLKNDWDVYGNVFSYSPHYPHYGQNGTGIGQGVVGGTGNLRFYNNTTEGIHYGYNAAYYNTGSGNESFNNIWVRCSRIRFVDADGAEPTNSDYTGLYACDDIGGHVEDHLQVFASNPIDPDFRPLFETEPGKTLPFPYNIDPDGNIRGEDGTWTRGAFEY